MLLLLLLRLPPLLLKLPQLPGAAGAARRCGAGTGSGLLAAAGCGSTVLMNTALSFACTPQRVCGSRRRS